MPRYRVNRTLLYLLFFSIRFVVNPESFGKTVENMFHASFLVKEDKAQIFIDPAKNLPFIQPIKKSRTQATESGDNSNKKQVRVKSWRSND